LLSLAKVRDVYVAIEQPLNSLMFKYYIIVDLIIHIDAHRAATALQAFTSPHMKHLEIYTTLPDHIVKAHIAKKGTRAGTKALAVRSDAGWTEGRKAEMKASKAYPHAFCKAIVDAAQAAA